MLDTTIEMMKDLKLDPSNRNTLAATTNAIPEDHDELTQMFDCVVGKGTTPDISTRELKYTFGYACQKLLQANNAGETSFNAKEIVEASITQARNYIKNNAWVFAEPTTPLDDELGSGAFVDTLDVNRSAQPTAEKVKRKVTKAPKAEKVKKPKLDRATQVCEVFVANPTMTKKEMSTHFQENLGMGKAGAGTYAGFVHKFVEMFKGNSNPTEEQFLEASKSVFGQHKNPSVNGPTKYYELLKTVL